MNPKLSDTAQRKLFPGPAMKAACFFVSGILAGTVLDIPPLTAMAALAVSLGVTIIPIVRGKSPGICAAILLVIGGSLAAATERSIRQPAVFPPEYIGQTMNVRGVIDRYGGIKYGGTYIILRCREYSAPGESGMLNGLLPCVIYNSYVPLGEGSSVTLSGTLKRYRRPVEKGNGQLFSGHIRFTHRLVVSSSASVDIHGNRTSFIHSVRAYIIKSVDRYRFGGHAALLKTMTIGDSGALSDDTRAVFSRSGVAHILAVSGLHVALIAGALHSLLRLVPVSKRFRSMLVISAMIAYAGLCGFRPPVTRAVLMLSLIFGAEMTERRKNTENSIFVALIIILAVNPSSLFGPSLQLSFAAVWGITTFYPVLRSIIVGKRRIPRSAGMTADLVIVSGVAQAVTAPVAAAHFGTLPLYGIPANLTAVPLTFIIVNLGVVSIAAAAAGAVLAPVTSVLAFATGIALKGLVTVTGMISAIPFASVPLDVSPLLAMTVLLWLFVLSRTGTGTACKKAALYIPLVSLLVVTWYPLASREFRNHQSGSIVFFDVGQGDAALVSCMGEYRFLIDAGPRYGDYNAGKGIIVPGLKNLGITHLDGLFVSHTHSDHTGGIESILEAVDVRCIYCRSAIADSLKRVFDTEIVAIGAGDSIAFRGGGILVLSPHNAKEQSPVDEKGENDMSLTLRFDIDGCRALFTGDIEDNTQRMLTAWGTRLKSDILKVPHHGAQGFDPAFLDAVTPSAAVISCGINNRYGHPGESTETLLGQVSSHVYRTDRDGSITVSVPSMQVSAY